jgi:hypothetical protein
MIFQTKSMNISLTKLALTLWEMGIDVYMMNERCVIEAIGCFSK